MTKLKIEKLVEGGQGLGYSDDPIYAGKTFFVWNALPGEEVEADILNKKKGVYEAVAINIIKPSPHRVAVAEDHFLSCSPWQVMESKYENGVKKEIARETFKRVGKLSTKEYLEILENIEISSDKASFGYRNKMEFSFIESDGGVSLAFFKRGQRRKTPIDGCELASSAINGVAKSILDWANQNKLTERNLKSLIIRSNKKGETIAGLFIKDRELSQISPNFREFNKYPQIDKKLLGFNLYYSTHKSPASVITEILHQEGQDFLIEDIFDKKFKYGINSFFQVNIPVFEMALKDIQKSIRENSLNLPAGRQGSRNLHLVDFYSGVGAIGLSVGNSHGCSIQLIESNEEAAGFVNENIKLNKTTWARHALPLQAEKALEYITKDSTVIFDPPRSGLHEKVVDRVLEAKPKKIIYLSCNIATQARDIGLIKKAYDIRTIKLYNFFPRTPHIESLCVLELK